MIKGHILLYDYILFFFDNIMLIKLRETLVKLDGQSIKFKNTP